MTDVDSSTTLWGRFGGHPNPDQYSNTKSLLVEFRRVGGGILSLNAISSNYHYQVIANFKMSIRIQWLHYCSSNSAEVSCNMSNTQDL